MRTDEPIVDAQPRRARDLAAKNRVHRQAPELPLLQRAAVERDQSRLGAHDARAIEAIAER